MLGLGLLVYFSFLSRHDFRRDYVLYHVFPTIRHTYIIVSRVSAIRHTYIIVSRVSVFTTLSLTLSIVTCAIVYLVCGLPSMRVDRVCSGVLKIIFVYRRS